MNSRLFSLRKFFAGIDGLLVTDISNVRYLSGFTGSSGFLLITKTKNMLITDFRYKEQSGNEIKGWDIFIEKKERIKTISGLSKKLGIKKLGFEMSVSYEFFSKLSKKEFVLKPLKNTVEKIRAVKDEEEITAIKTAVLRAEEAFGEVKRYIKCGIRETRISGMLAEGLKKRGCKRLPFDIIVASGKNSSMPHAGATDKKLEAGDLVVIDWGGEAGGYFSDMTRTFLIKGKDIRKKKEIYNIVLKANRSAVAAVSAGVDVRQVDSSARHVIKKAGYGEFFGHGTGHGVGLQIHEAPNISWRKRDLIKENMVFTVEPGIYLPGIGGVRIEDMVVAGRKNADLLTSLPRELEIISS